MAVVCRMEGRKSRQEPREPSFRRPLPSPGSGKDLHPAGAQKRRQRWRQGTVQES